MPYGDLMKEKCMRFATYSDLQDFRATIEEREEYEPYIEQGLVVYSGVDYQAIIEQAEKEADVVIWDGGNNEVSFYVPDFLIVVADPLRPGAEKLYHPGEVNVRNANAFVVNKVNAVKNPEDVEEVLTNLKAMNPSAAIVMSDSVIKVTDEHLIKGRRCLIVEDGPTTTHGNMSYGAGWAATEKFGGIVVEPPMKSLKGGMKKLFEDNPHLKMVVPAMGYNDAQKKDLIATLNAIDADCIVNGSPLDLGKYLEGLNKPVVRVTYDIEQHKGGFAKGPTLDNLLGKFQHDFLRKARG
jgi:predicted GTPase